MSDKVATDTDGSYEATAGPAETLNNVFSLLQRHRIHPRKSCVIHGTLSAGSQSKQAREPLGWKMGKMMMGSFQAGLLVVIEDVQVSLEGWCGGGSGGEPVLVDLNGKKRCSCIYA